MDSCQNIFDLILRPNEHPEFQNKSSLLPWAKTFNNGFLVGTRTLILSVKPASPSLWSLDDWDIRWATSFSQIATFLATFSQFRIIPKKEWLTYSHQTFAWYFWKFLEFGKMLVWKPHLRKTCTTAHQPQYTPYNLDKWRFFSFLRWKSAKNLWSQLLSAAALNSYMQRNL